jgi:hypothetical protein
MDDNASAHPADSHGAARNPNPDSFVPINPLDPNRSIAETEKLIKAAAIAALQ